jgi:hypothetical protein
MENILPAAQLPGVPGELFRPIAQPDEEYVGTKCTHSRNLIILTVPEMECTVPKEEEGALHIMLLGLLPRFHSRLVVLSA